MVRSLTLPYEKKEFCMDAKCAGVSIYFFYKPWTRALLAILWLFGLQSSLANADSRFNRSLVAQLDGFREVPPIITDGKGRFHAKIDLAAGTISYKLTYSGLPSAATAAHIHLGQPGVNGGILAFLCGGPAKAACPPSGTVTGTLAAGDMLGPNGQVLAPHDFNKALRALLRKNCAYVNIHSTGYPAGEIRGDLRF